MRMKQLMASLIVGASAAVAFTTAAAADMTGAYAQIIHDVLHRGSTLRDAVERAHQLLARAPFLNRLNTRFIEIHFHEELPHGDQIISALASFDTSSPLAIFANSVPVSRAVLRPK